MADLPDPLPDPPGPLQVLTFRQEPITKTDPQAWYERNLFWGCFTSAVAIIFGVITAMTKDIRWVLFGAWPFASIALWTALNFFVYRKFLTSIGSIVILVGICFLYALLNPEQMAPIAKETSLSQKDLQDTTHGAPSRFWESEPSKETTKSEPPKPKLEDKPPPKPESAVSPASPICSVVANVSADVVSRVYYHDTEKTGEQILNPTSQELFYEWKAVL